MADITQELDVLYKATEVLAPKPPSIPLGELLQDIYTSTVKADSVDRFTARKVMSYLQGGLLKGFHKNFMQLPYGSSKHKLLAQLHYNLATFTAFKNHSQICAMTENLVDKRGKKHSFDFFKQTALATHGKYNVEWLHAEHRMAYLQGQAASKWQNFISIADSLPNLCYKAALSGDECRSHSSWDGIIRPVEDPFWDIYYPPNGWNCQCDTYQTTKPSTGNIVTTSFPGVLFRVHSGKTGRIVGTEHPYYRTVFQDIDKKAKLFAINFLRKEVENWAKKHIKGKTVKKEDMEVIISKSGIEKHVYTSHPENYYQLLALYDVVSLLKHARRYGRPIPNTGKNLSRPRDVKFWHYFEVDVNGVPSLINVREEKGGAFRFYGISQKNIKKK